jgi:hypothetical protein
MECITMGRIILLETVAPILDLQGRRPVILEVH